jgi:transketolase
MEDQIRIKHLCVREIPRSGPSAALMNMFKIDAEAIVEAVESFQQ